MKKIQLVAMLALAVVLVNCKQSNNTATIANEPSIAERISQERSEDAEIESKIDDLISKMSLTEKVGQMTQVNETFFAANNTNNEATGVKAELIDEEKFANTVKEYQVGSFFTGGTRNAEEWVEISKMLQEINLENQLNKIPFIFGVDHIHGANYLANGTIFPHAINLGATFNPSFSYYAGEVTAQETADLGHHWNFAPVLGIGKQKKWPRLYETFGEDQLVASVMGAEYIKGIQGVTTKTGRKQAGCAKHFIGYSIPNSGWDRTPVEIGAQTFQEVLVPSFQASFDAGALTTMINGGEINGIPVHASYYHLTTLLRDQMGFKGVALTDYRDIIKLHTEHFVTENEKESTYVAIQSGIDMSMTPVTLNFPIHLKELVEEGRITEERIDLSVRRILRLKFQLGLFEKAMPTSESIAEIGSPDKRDKSRKAAEESIVLLKNENDVLPLSDPKKIVLAGPNADKVNPLSGGWTFIWQGNDEAQYPESFKTLEETLIEEFSGSQVVSAQYSTLKMQPKELMP